MKEWKFVSIVVLGVLAMAIGIFVWAWAGLVFSAGVNTFADVYMLTIAIMAGAAYVFAGYKIAMYGGSVK